MEQSPKSEAKSNETKEKKVVIRTIKIAKDQEESENENEEYMTPDIDDDTPEDSETEKEYQRTRKDDLYQ